MRRGWFHSGHHGWHHHRRRFEHHRLRFGHGGRHAWHLAPQHAVRQARSFGGESGGLASWYSGRRTANGELFSGSAFTAAHRFYPFGTRVRVTCQSTGRSVVVRINDRGPFIKGRVIDLSRSAALAVGISGIGRVSLRRL